MANLVQVESIALLNSAALGTAYTPAQTPIKMRLMTGTAPTSTVAGTEVTNASGSTYAAIAVTGTGGVGFGTSGTQAVAGSGGTAGLAVLTNASAINFTNMPGSITVTAVELWDSTAVTPIRRWFGTLTAPKSTNLGDTLSFAASSITLTIG